jgi:hypothetical protein
MRKRLHFNGIDATTGEYLSPPMTAEELIDLLDPAREELTAPRTRRPRFGVDPRDLSASGWGVIFPREGDPAVRRALEPLLEHRRRQAEPRFRDYSGADGYHEGESSSKLLHRLGVGPGAIDPDKAPYYLLLVGGPEEIPFHLQYELALAFAVGRLSFDTPAEYARYARTVVAAETGEVRRPRRVDLLATCHDEATEQTCRGLTAPLARYLAEALEPGARSSPRWQVVSHLGEEANKERFGRVFGGDGTPALAFTAGHGSWFPAGDPRQREQQGALVCQEGPTHGDDGAATARFSGADVGDGACPAGLVSFHFACYGAGCPALDDFAHKSASRQPRAVAPQPLVAGLPRRLLSHPNGSALAVVGHVDRAWGWSYAFGNEYHREVFESTLAEILSGYPVGAAMERFGERHGQLAGMLAAAGQRRSYGLEVDPKEYADLLTATHDARNYVVLGDPAVRLAVDWDEEAT